MKTIAVPVELLKNVLWFITPDIRRGPAWDNWQETHDAIVKLLKVAHAKSLKGKR